MIKRRIFSWLMCFLILIVCGNQGEAQSTTKTNTQSSIQTASVFNNLEDCVGKAEKKYKSGEAKEILVSIRKSFDFINDKWLGSGAKELPQEYLKTLDGNCKLLVRASENSNQVEAINQLKNAKKDLALKEAAARRGTNAAESLISAISVRVRTFDKNGKEVSGYLVECAEQLHADNDKSLFPFNDETSPSTRELPPGYYKIWIVKNGSKISSRDIEVGDNDSEEIRFTLP